MAASGIHVHRPESVQRPGFVQREALSCRCPAAVHSMTTHAVARQGAPATLSHWQWLWCIRYPAQQGAVRRRCRPVWQAACSSHAPTAAHSMPCAAAMDGQLLRSREQAVRKKNYHILTTRVMEERARTMQDDACATTECLALPPLG